MGHSLLLTFISCSKAELSATKNFLNPGEDSENFYKQITPRAQGREGNKISHYPFLSSSRPIGY